jgi:hypothetical protein
VKKATGAQIEALREEVASSNRDLELAINDFEVEVEELRTANRFNFLFLNEAEVLFDSLFSSLKLDYIAERDEVDSLLLELKKLEERVHDTEKDLDDETERASAVHPTFLFIKSHPNAVP